MNNNGQWWTRSWNPISGCTPISAGCRNCWARRTANRLQKMGIPKYQNGFAVTFHPEVLEDPRRWTRPQRIFCCDMADIFHADVQNEWLEQIWDMIFDTPHHQYFILTKRPERIMPFKAWMEKSRYRNIVYDNIWLGTSVEDQRTAKQRIPELMNEDGLKKFLSIEPLLGPVDLRALFDFYAHRLGWVIAGAETGPGARPMNLDWARAIRDECRPIEIPFFLKAVDARHNRILDGRTWDERPE